MTGEIDAGVRLRAHAVSSSALIDGLLALDGSPWLQATLVPVEPSSPFDGLVAPSQGGVWGGHHTHSR